MIKDVIIHGTDERFGLAFTKLCWSFLFPSANLICTPYRKARYTPCDRSATRTHKIHRYAGGSGLSADRGGCSFALGENSPDRIEVVERFYEGEFDDTKTDAGRRSIPLDSFGILRGVLDAAWHRSKHRNPGDLVFTNARGGPVNRRNLLRRHLKPTIKKLGLPASVDFRSFRTMHSSLMSSIGVRPEVTRDNMGHATVDVTQNVYNRTWWEEKS